MSKSLNKQNFNLFSNMENGYYDINPISFPKGLLVLLCLDLLQIIFQLILYPITLIGKDIYVLNGLVLFISEFIINFIIIYIFILIFNNKNYSLTYPLNTNYNKSRINKLDILLVALLIISMRFVFDNSLGYLVALIPMPEFVEKAFENITSNYINAFGSICIIAPLFEELLCRGLLLNGLLKRYSPKKAIILSALLFAIMHLNFTQGINAFILGLVLATVYYYTRSIYLCMFMHFVNNSFAFILGPFESINLPLPIQIIVSVILVILGLIIFYLSFKKLNLKERLNYQSKLTCK